MALSKELLLEAYCKMRHIRYRFLLGVIGIDKRVLTEQLHAKVVGRIWWFVRLSIVGLLVNLVHALL